MSEATVMTPGESSQPWSRDNRRSMSSTGHPQREAVVASQVQLVLVIREENSTILAGQGRKKHQLGA